MRVLGEQTYFTKKSFRRERQKNESLKMKQNTIENSVNAALKPTSKHKFKCDKWA